MAARVRTYIRQPASPAAVTALKTQEDHKAPAVENFAWLPVEAVSTKTGRGSVSLI